MFVDIFNTDKKYQIIYADPPWKYNDKMTMTGIHGAIKGAEQFYNTMSNEDIKNLPVSKIANKDCILFVWVTMPFLNEVFELIKSWGFKYKTCAFCWVKTTKNGKIHHGMGHYTRGNAELCLIATKGKSFRRLNNSVSQIILSMIQQHSKKPDVIRDKILELYGPLPRIELFARQVVDGWDCWGNEVEEKKQVDIDDLMEA